MDPLKITLPTFLKVCARSSRGMLSDLRTFMAPGGYDFYKVMKRLVAGIANGDMTIEQAQAEVAKIIQKPERENTLDAINRFHDWFLKRNLKRATLPKGTFKSKSGLLIVRVEPELAFIDDEGIVSILYLWNLKKPDLKNDLAGEGVQMMINTMPGAHFEYGIFDLRTMKIHGTETVSANTNLHLQNDLHLVEEVWRDLHNPTLSVEDRIEHIKSLKLPGPPPA